RARPAPAAAGAARAATGPAGTSAGPPAALDEPEALTILPATAAALARGAEPLCGAAASAARLILVAEPRVLGGRRALVALRHDPALVDPDLDADPSDRRLRLGEAVVDVGADRVERDAALRIGLTPAHLATAEPSAADDLDPLGARAHRRREGALH